MCGSGMNHHARPRYAAKAGSNRVVIAGGMESMTNAPYILPKARGGYRLGHGELKDHMFLDGLEDAYNPGRLMGTYAEKIRRPLQLPAVASRMNSDAMTRWRAGAGGDQGWPLQGRDRAGNGIRAKGDVLIADDEQPGKASADKIRS